MSAVAVTGDGTILAFMLGEGLPAAPVATLDWEVLSDGFGDRYLLLLAIDSTTPDRLYASTQANELLASLDGGQSWQLLAAP